MSVYFAQVGPYIKIGYSENPDRRVRNLMASATRYGAPKGTPTRRCERHLIRSIRGSKNTEALIHQALADFCAGNEWFVDEPEVRDFIANVECATEYRSVVRPVGEYYSPMEIGPDEARQLRKVLDGLFDGTILDRRRIADG
jgi:hypothetical protein